MLKNFKFPLSIIKYKLNKFRNEKHVKKKKTFEEIKLSKKIQSHGYCIIDNFINKNECIKIIKTIEDKIANNPDGISEDKIKSDQRIFFSENLSDEIYNFSDEIYNFFCNEVIKNVGEAYTTFKLKAGFTMANKLSYKIGNLGSGGGWHKDAYYSQYKAILYLTDVSSENGPFQFIKNSHKLLNTLNISIKLRKGYPDTRFSENDLKIILDKEKLKTLEASAGSLILFDGSLIHRGAPIKKGIRYALTNYYFPINSYEQALKKFTK